MGACFVQMALCILKSLARNYVHCVPGHASKSPSAVLCAGGAVQPHNRTWDRWLMMGSIGVATGLVAYCLYVVSCKAQ
jgi:hypothetical protein